MDSNTQPADAVPPTKTASKPLVKRLLAPAEKLRGYSSNSERVAWLLILLPSLLMVGGWWLMPSFGATVPVWDNPFAGPQLFLMMIAGLTLMAAPRLIERAADNPRPLILLGIILAGTGLRLATLGTDPYFENDFFRYLWDGALTARGISPYGHAPFEVLNPGLVVRDQLDVLLPLAEQAGDVVQNINHNWLSTIYPPVAQAFFAIAHFIAPFKIDGLRIVFGAVDLFNLFLMLTILRAMGRSSLWIALYWLNPLVISEVFNSAHMDVLIIPFVLLAFVFAARRWSLLAVSFLAGAVAVKVWPILFLPLVLRPVWSMSKAKACRDTVWFGVSTALLLRPMILPIALPLITGDASSAPAAGTTAYTKTWQMNDSLFQPILWISSSAIAPIFTAIGLELTGQSIARLLISAVVGLIALFVALPGWSQLDQVFKRALLIVAVLFLLSPTQFPWYALWFLFFLPFVPVAGLLLFSCTLMLYYLRPLIDSVDGGANIDLYDLYLVWLSHVPVYLLLFRDFVLRKRRPAGAP